MFIRNVRVERYGALREQVLSLPEGLTVVYGPNEAGKSSVMALIRAVLYGFPARDGTEAASSGAWSGAVTLAVTGAEAKAPARAETGGGVGTGAGGRAGGGTGEGVGARVGDGVGAARAGDGAGTGAGAGAGAGVALVERKEAAAVAGRARTTAGGALRVTLADGRTGGEALLREWLGGIGAEPFRSVFAFSLSELQELRTLQSEELNAFLYSAGLGLDGRLILTAERRLAQELEQLYRPRGKNQPLSAALRDIDRLETELRESRSRQDRYDGMAVELQTLDEQIADETERLKRMHADLAWLEAAEQAIVHRRQSRAIALELAELPMFTLFPPDALPRFERLEGERRRAAAEHQRLAETEAELARQLAELPTEEPALAQIAELEPLLAEAAGYEQDRRTIAELELEAAQQEAEIGAQLRQIGADWTAERLAEVPATVPTQERIREHREVLAEAKAERAAAAAAAAASERERAEHSARTQRLQRELASALPALGLEPGAAPTLRSRLAAVRRTPLAAELPALRRLVRQREQLRRERELAGAAPAPLPAAAPALHGRRRAGGAASQEAGRASTRSGEPRSLLSPPGFLRLAALLLLAGAVAAVALAPPSGRLPALAVAAGLAAAAAALAFAAGRLARAADRPAEPPAVAAGLERLLRDTDAALAERLAAAAALPEVAAGGLALAPEAVSEDALDRLERQALLWQEAADEAERRFRAWESAAAEEEGSAARLNRDRDRLERAERCLAIAAEAWAAWLRAHRLPLEISPDAAAAIMHRLNQAQERLEAKRRTAIRREALLVRQRAFESQVSDCLGLSAAKDAAAALRAWEHARRAAEDRQTARLQLERERKQMAERGALLEIEEAQLRDMIHTLWREAGAGDEASFRERLEQKNRREALQQESRRLDSLVEAHIGSGETHLVRLDEWLAADAPYALKTALEEKRQAVELLDQTLDGCKDRRGRLAGELELLEEGNGHADKLQRLEEHKATLDSLAGEWSVRALAAALLRRTKAIYERERQPALLKAASGYFRTVTGGRFVRVVMPLGEQRLVAERVSGDLVDSASMSRGTAEQLYLAMRFALADELERAHGVVLPMVMDDVFVNFDRERLGHTLALLGQLAQRRQLLYFTCHPHVMDSFREAGVSFHELRLGE